MAVVNMTGQAKIELGRRPVAVEYQGKIRCFADTFTTAAASTGPGNGPINNADVIIVGFLPAGARILPGGIVYFGAFGASTTITVGTYTRSGSTYTAVSAAKYLGSTSVASLGTASIAATAALGALDKMTVDTYIAITAGGANFANAQVLSIYLPFVSD